jgi:hypothetical protein
MVFLVVFCIGCRYSNNEADKHYEAHREYFWHYSKEFNNANLKYWQWSSFRNIDSANYYDGRRQAFYEAENYIFKQMQNIK